LTILQKPYIFTKTENMRKLSLTLLLFGACGLMYAESQPLRTNGGTSAKDSTGRPASKGIEIGNQADAMADTFSLIGSAFFKGDGATIAWWDYDIDFTYEGTVGNESFYKINRQELLFEGEFKVRHNHNWTDPSYGFNELTIVSPDNFGWMGYNVKVLARRVYDITFIVNNVTNTHTLSLQYSLPLKLNAIIKKASSAPVIDGQIDAVWATANVYSIDQPLVSNTPTLGAPGSTVWSGLWTNDGIYILLVVNDDVFFPAYAGANPTWVWEYDKPEIYFDVNSILADGLGPSAPNSGHIQIAPDFIAGQISGTPITDWSGVTNAFQVANPSYVAEYFIPFSKLVDMGSAIVPKTATMGFDVTITDRDSEAGFRQRAVWTNFGLTGESWSNMDDCGTIILTGPGANNLVTGITVSGAAGLTTITKEAGTLLMNADILPVDATNKGIIWTVTNGTGKAIINNAGLLTAVDNGTVTVTATAKDGSSVSGSKVIAISNQYISFADGSLIKDGGFETDGPIPTVSLPARWNSWSDNGGTASVIGGVCTIKPGAVNENWHMQVNQFGWKVGNDTSYNLSFIAWSDSIRTFTIDMEDPNNNFTRLGSSTDPEAINGWSEWVVPLTTTPTVFTFHTTINAAKVTTKFLLNILTSATLKTVYIDNVSLLNLGHLPYGSGPPIAGTAASNSTICAGTSGKMTLTGSSGFIQWQHSADGTTGWANVTSGTGADSTVFSTQSLTATTYYRAQVTNQSFPAVYSNVIKVTVNPLPDAAGTLTGATTVCHDQKTSVIYSVPIITNATSYLWTIPAGATGTSTARNITVKYGPNAVSGNITVSGRNACGNGTASTLPVTVNYPFEGEKICLVTIDLETGKNMVVWEKTPNKGIASYNVYREGTVVNTYDLIGNVPVAKMSVFVDLASKPEQQQYTYKISAVDTCGNESAKSPWHQTMFLQYVSSVNGVNLNWQEYKTETGVLSFNSYAIFRGSDSTALTELATIASSSLVYTDKTSQALSQRMFYRVGGVKAVPCVSTGLPGKKTSSGPYVHSLSNLEDNRLQGTGISNKLADAFKLTIYPSPFTDVAIINYTLQKPTTMKVEIYNVVGEKIGVLADESQTAGSHVLEMKASDVNFVNGLYYLRFVADYQVIIRKVMLSR
jgi:hypothetical protein